MDSYQKLRIPLLLIILVLIGGTVGYRLLYPVSLIDAFYMTTISVSTVGFREVFPLDDWGKIFTSLIIFFGIGSITLTATYLFQFVVEGHLLGMVKRRKMEKKIDSVRDHYIICGFGRVGEQVARDFDAEGRPFVVIDNNPQVLPRIQEKGYIHVSGNATQDQDLIRAGIEAAKGVLATSDSDPDNVLIVLSARLLNPSLFIVARASTKEMFDKLHRAGANRVVSPYVSTGQRMASMMMKPFVHEYIETMAYGGGVEIQIEELEVSRGSGILGKTLYESSIRKLTGSTILAIKKPSGRIITNPPVSSILERGDRLIIVGTADQLEKANQMIVSPEEITETSQ